MRSQLRVGSHLRPIDPSGQGFCSFAPGEPGNCRQRSEQGAENQGRPGIQALTAPQRRRVSPQKAQAEHEQGEDEQRQAGSRSRLPVGSPPQRLSFPDDQHREQGADELQRQPGRQYTRLVRSRQGPPGFKRRSIGAAFHPAAGAHRHDQRRQQGQQAIRQLSQRTGAAGEQTKPAPTARQPGRRARPARRERSARSPRVAGKITPVAQGKCQPPAAQRPNQAPDPGFQYLLRLSLRGAPDRPAQSKRSTQRHQPGKHIDRKNLSLHTPIIPCPLCYTQFYPAVRFACNQTDHCCVN